MSDQPSRRNLLTGLVAGGLAWLGMRRAPVASAAPLVAPSAPAPLPTSAEYDWPDRYATTSFVEDGKLVHIVCHLSGPMAGMRVRSTSAIPWVASDPLSPRQAPEKA
jgi:hypothetical protein